MDEKISIENWYVPMTEQQKKKRIKRENRTMLLLFLAGVLTFLYPFVSPTITESYTEITKVDDSSEIFYYTGSKAGVVINGFADGTLEMLEIPENIEKYRVIGIGEAAFQYCNEIMEVIIPDGITEIQEYAFSDCENLQYVKLPSGITALETAVFDDCKKLDRVVIPDSVEVLEQWAFSDCHALTEITFSQNLKTIGYAVFETCISLTEIRLPDSVEEIHPEAFIGCTNLKRVYAPEGSYAADWARGKGYEVITE